MTGQLRIIVLDTSPTTRKVLEVILHREGYLVACFDDPLEALRALSRHGAADLLFLCLDLPKMDGFAVLKYLRGESRFRSMGTIALLHGRGGVLARLKARRLNSPKEKPIRFPGSREFGSRPRKRDTHFA